MADRERQHGRIALALQGGGSFGAFTWGVLDRLLEDGAEFDAISGASAGSINAVLLASGLQKGGPDGARAALDGFWHDVADTPGLPSFALTALAASAPFVSPYYHNPLGLNPLRDLLAKHVDFERLRAAPPVRLMIAATRVRDGGLRIFREDEVSLDAVLASACLPMMQRAVEIDGEAYWDGAYSVNPPLRRLAIETEAEDILLVQIMPEEVDAVPQMPSEIAQRAHEIGFNASLQRELQALEDLRAGCHGATALSLPTARKLQRLRLHRITATDWVSDLGARNMLDTSPTLLTELHAAGRKAVSDGRADETRQAA
ncbi:MAG TPA: patatin-like phospholipase family protein [Acidisphaera sp.]|nr:patatin-like phospholipase family protein [Acidisphaera sp.]